MKILTVNFVTCAVKACKTSPASFPLHFKDAELQQNETEYNPQFILNILPRLDWEALRSTAVEACIDDIIFPPTYLESIHNEAFSLELVMTN